MVAEKRTTANAIYKLNYYYDQTGICGFSYNNQQYYYQKNLQGDIIMLYNSNVELMAKYNYDAFGNATVCNPDGTVNTSATFIGNLNPFRYRGYYFDTDSGLYYLQSRYYDPKVGRWLNADKIGIVAALGKGIINGLDSFNYCFNDPINYVDYGGCFPSKNKGTQGKTGIRQSEPWLYKKDGTPFDYDTLQGMYNAQPNTKEGRANRQIIKKQQKWIPEGRHHGEHSMSYVSLPRWQEGFSIVSVPTYQEGFSNITMPSWQEGFSVVDVPMYQEGFSNVTVPSWQEGFSNVGNSISNWWSGMSTEAKVGVVVVGAIIVASIVSLIIFAPWAAPAFVLV